MTRTSLLLVAGFLGAGLAAEPSRCLCDPARPETLEARECGLCREAERQPAEVEIFFLKDTSPRKPNRWLVLPRAHGKGLDSLADMTLRQRTRLWAAAIKKAKELWGDQWGLAYNGDKVRTQCHMHIHIGKLLRGIETRRKLVVVNGPTQIPKPKDGEGIWVHPQGRKLHVHLGEQTCETVLLR
jgi:diadenosine tetraphosphate (Ap4A) HIT family hydrolase